MSADLQQKYPAVEKNAKRPPGKLRAFPVETARRRRRSSLFRVDPIWIWPEKVADIYTGRRLA